MAVFNRTWVAEFWAFGFSLWSCDLLRCVSFFPEMKASVAWTRDSVIISALSMHSWAVPTHSLISCDSDILASVFLTRRAVRRQAGLWAQHSVISFPICLKHWEDKDWCYWRHSFVCAWIMKYISIYFYLITGPSIWKGWSKFLNAYHLSHVFIWGVCGN